MSGKRYTDEFKVEAVKQVTERGPPMAEVFNEANIKLKLFRHLNQHIS